MPRLSEFPTVGTAAATDCFVMVAGPTGAKQDVLLPRSALPTGITAPTTRLPVKGDNAGGLLAQAVVPVGNVGAITLTNGTDVVVISAALTTPLVITLAPLASYAPGHHLVIRDPNGFVSGINTVSVDGAGTETVNGLTGPVVAMNVPRQVATLGVAWGRWQRRQHHGAQRHAGRARAGRGKHRANEWQQLREGAGQQRGQRGSGGHCQRGD